MYDYLIGFLVDKKKTDKGTFVSLQVNDTGYLLEVTESDFICVKTSETEKIKIFVLLIHREDAMNLFGFFNRETRDIFQILLSVSGVGAKMALSLLNEFNIYDLISLVVNSDYKELTRAKGVGPKLAQKIILELKDKLMKTGLQKTKMTLPKNQAIEDAQSVLLSLGYEVEEIEFAINNVLSTLEDDSNTEEILRKALTCLSM